MLPVKNFTDFIDENNLFNHNSSILAAVSGGMDSVLLARLLKATGFNFGIAHCNFKLRGAESDHEQQFCRELAQQLNVPFHTVDFDTLTLVNSKKISTQMAARQLRYHWFQQIGKQYGYTVTALAHHKNDAIETILLNLVRGTGIAGLHGILPKNGLLVRPLLFLTREEIKNLVVENGFAFVEDSSNASVKYTRNRIRLEIIPKLKALNPQLEQTFENNLEHFRSLELLLNQRVAELKRELFIPHGEDEIHLPVNLIKKLEPKKLLLFNLFKQYGFNKTVIEDLMEALDKHSGRVFESTDFKLLLDREKLILSKKGSTGPRFVTINKKDHGVYFGNYKLTILHDDSPLIVKNNPMAASIDSDLLIYPLTLRRWEQGDYFYPIGMKNKKKVSDFFIGQKIPLHEKDQIPLLTNGNGEIMWIGGYRPDERYKVTNRTKKVTIFELVKD